MYVVVAQLESAQSGAVVVSTYYPTLVWENVNHRRTILIVWLVAEPILGESSIDLERNHANESNLSRAVYAGSHARRYHAPPSSLPTCPFMFDPSPPRFQRNQNPGSAKKTGSFASTVVGPSPSSPERETPTPEMTCFRRRWWKQGGWRRSGVLWKPTVTPHRCAGYIAAASCSTANFRRRKCFVHQAGAGGLR